MIHSRRFIPVEDVLDIFDNNRWWMYIPGFNGYEVSNDGYLRSMKHFRKYPYGIIIKPVDRDGYKGSCDPLYEISDDNNKRQRIRLSQLMHLAATNQYAVRGYPRSTIVSNSSARNKFVQDSNGVYKKVYNGPGCRNSLNTPPMDNTAHYAKFTIIQDGTEALGMTYRQPEYIVPVEPISKDSNEYYGRQDCRVKIAEPINDMCIDHYYG